MATITAAAATLTTPRISVTVSGWATDGPIIVSRVHPDGTSWAVRGIPDVSGGASFGYDYEAPLNSAVSYSASGVSSGAVSTGVTDAWLLVPGLPQQAQKVLPSAIPDDDYTRPMVQLAGPFRAYPAVEFGEMSSPSATLQLITQSAAEFASLMSIFTQSGVLLLRMPGSTMDWRYVAVSSVKPSNPTRVLDQPVKITTLSTIAVLAPAGGVFGDPSASYQALLDSGKTYQQLLDWKGTGATVYLDLLRGGF